MFTRGAAGANADGVVPSCTLRCLHFCVMISRYAMSHLDATGTASRGEAFVIPCPPSKEVSVNEKVMIGPFPPPFIGRLTDPLRQRQLSFRLLKDEAAMEYQRQRNLAVGPTSHPQFVAEDTIYLEICPMGLELLRPELERLALLPMGEPQEFRGEETDYLCPRCDHSQTTLGLCPKHRIPLLEYSAWVADRTDQATRRDRILIGLIALGLAFWGLWLFI